MRGFVRLAGLLEPPPGRPFPFSIPAVGALENGMSLHPGVTYLVGENGSGKSTLLEAIARAAGLNPEGGSSNLSFSTRATESELGEHIRLVRGVTRPRTAFFLRAESLFNVATAIEQLPDREASLRPYGGVSLHDGSHGESFLRLVLHRFGREGFYVMDEPEAARSPQNCLTLLRRIHELVQQGSQFIIATHSPLILAYPDALIYELGPAGLDVVSYDDAEPVRLIRAFLGAPERFTRVLFED